MKNLFVRLAPAAAPGSLPDSNLFQRILRPSPWLPAFLFVVRLAAAALFLGAAPLASAKLTPTFSGLLSKSIKYGRATISLSGTLGSGSTYPASGETLTVTIDGTTQTASFTNSAGAFGLTYSTASIPSSVTPYSITYAYEGDASLNGATNTSTTLTVAMANCSTAVSSSSYPSVYGQSGVTFTATETDISINSSAIPTGTVQFQTNGVNFGSAVTLSSGSATSIALPATLAPGNYTVTAAYSGDANFNPSSGEVSSATTTLHSFTGGSDGSSPEGRLTLCGDSLYGTAYGGGDFGNGALFSVNTNTLVFTTLYSFTGGDDGANPAGGLIMAGHTLYGTAYQGGAEGVGTVFSFDTDSQVFTTLHTFNFQPDGGYPIAGLVLSGDTLFGTALRGGGENQAGTVFSLNINTLVYTVLHAFTAESDGASPEAGLILSGDTLFGTTYSGGDSRVGTVYSINTNTLLFTTLYAFTNGYDGAYPYAGLILSGGTLYGAAGSGGYYGSGAVFSLDTNTLEFTTLYAFTGEADGATPFGGLILSGTTLYGTTYTGGNSGPGRSGSGTLYSINTNSLGFTNVYEFTVTTNAAPYGNPDGAGLYAGLILAGNTFYGTAAYGGSSGVGTVFSIAAASVYDCQPVDPLPVIFKGARAYDGTANAAFGILSVVNAVGGDVVRAASGNATLASASVGTQTFASFAGLALGGLNAGNYTLTGASGTVTITNSFSPFSITSSALDDNGANFVVCWESVPGVVYNVLTNTSLAAPTSWAPAGNPIIATNTTTCYTLPGGIAGNTNVFVVIQQ